MNNTQNNKDKPDGKQKDATESQQRIVFPSFDLSTKKTEFGNGSNRVITIAYEIKYYPAHSTLLKSLLIKSSVLDPIQQYDFNIHFVPHGLIQCLKKQITHQSRFLFQTGIVPIFNILEETMNSVIKTRLFDISSVTGLEPTY